MLIACATTTRGDAGQLRLVTHNQAQAMPLVTFSFLVMPTIASPPRQPAGASSAPGNHRYWHHITLNIAGYDDINRVTPIREGETYGAFAGLEEFALRFIRAQPEACCNYTATNSEKCQAGK